MSSLTFVHSTHGALKHNLRHVATHDLCTNFCRCDVDIIYDPPCFRAAEDLGVLRRPPPQPHMRFRGMHRMYAGCDVMVATTPADVKICLHLLEVGNTIVMQLPLPVIEHYGPIVGRLGASPACWASDCLGAWIDLCSTLSAKAMRHMSISQLIVKKSSALR